MKLKAVVCMIAIAVGTVDGLPKNNGWDSKRYAKHSTPQFNNAIKEIPLLRLSGTERILDIGCGTGKLAAYIEKRFLPKGSVHGIDSSVQQIQRAQKEYGNNKNLSFAQADLFSYKTEWPYDAVISFWVLHWIKDYKRAMQKIFSLLKPGGKALIGQLAEHELLVSQEIKKMMQEDQWKSQCKSFDYPIYSLPLDRIVQAARDAGFVIEYVQLVNEKETFKDAEAYKQHHQALPIAECIPAEKKEQFFTEAIDRALPREHHHKNGSITANGYVVYMLLRKPFKTHMYAA